MQLFKRKKQDAAPEEGIGGIRSGGVVSLRRVALTTWVLTGLLLVLLASGLEFVQKQQVTDDRQRSARAVVNAISTQISDILLERRALATGLAVQPELIAAAKNNDAGQISALEKSYAKLIGSTGRVFVFNPKKTKVTQKRESGWWGFATIALASKAQKQAAKQPIEIHAYGPKARRMVMAVPVADAEYVMVVMWPLDGLKSSVSSAALAGLPLLLKQRDGLQLFSTGDLPTIPSTMTLEGSSLELQYGATPQRTGILTYARWLAWGILFAVMGLVIYQQSNVLHRRMRGDLDTMAALATDAFRGRVHHNYPVRLKESQHSLEKLVEEAREFVSAAHRLRRKQQANDTDEAVAAEATTDAGSDAVPKIEGFETSEDTGSDGASANSAESAWPEQLISGYDLRGLVDDYLIAETAYWYGRALGSEAYEIGQDTVVVGRDHRESSAELSEALVKGIVESGRTVIDVGETAAPVWFYSVLRDGPGTGVFVTGGHCSLRYNGIKTLLRGEFILPERLLTLRQRAVSGNLLTGEGKFQTSNFAPEYVEALASNVNMQRPIRVVVDGGNSPAGIVAKAVFSGMGASVTLLNDDIDAELSSRNPSIHSVKALAGLRKAMGKRRAEIGFAFDADGDSLVAVDQLGNIFYADTLATLLAYDVLSGQPGVEILYDPRCSRYLASEVVTNGGRPVATAVGYAGMMGQMRLSGAPLGVEFSGHIFLADRWNGTPDAIYAAARVLEVLSADQRPVHEVLAQMPSTANTQEFRVHLPEGQAETVMSGLNPDKFLVDAKVTRRDGLRAEFPRGWGIVRAMRTEPGLAMRFEADTEEELGKAQKLFKEMLRAVQPDLPL